MIFAHFRVYEQQQRLMPRARFQRPSENPRFVPHPARLRHVEQQCLWACAKTFRESQWDVFPSRFFTFPPGRSIDRRNWAHSPGSPTGAICRSRGSSSLPSGASYVSQGREPRKTWAQVVNTLRQWHSLSPRHRALRVPPAVHRCHAPAATSPGSGW